MVKKLIYKLHRNAINIPGWTTKRKIVIFESDDWGSIRMPSKSVYEKLHKSKLDLSSHDFLRYNVNDTLESTEDLISLFELLDRYRDINNRSAVFTAISVMANPDFGKISETNFSEYHFEPFPETLLNYHNGIDVFKVWKEGVEKGFFVPEFHGREHLNVANWMDALRNNDPQTKLAFNNGFWSFNPSDQKNSKYNFQAAFDSNDIENEINLHKVILSSGAKIYKELFGIDPYLFVAPNGIISRILEESIKSLGVRFMNYSYINKEPIKNGKYKFHLSYQGKSSRSGLIHITRNCSFEPSFNQERSVSNCLYQISKAFSYNKPAIISTHRVNYIGTLNESNRTSGLKYLNQLLQEIQKIWPEVEFASTRDIEQSYNYFKHE